jgi:dTDP-L-rhamnose 4-epimerase
MSLSTRNVLITGGAGFIGSHLADELLSHGYRVRVLDNLMPHVHGGSQRRPVHLAPDVELVIGDVRDAATVTRALADIDAVFHFAAVVGGGQGMHDVELYTSVNHGGTAVLMDRILKKPVQRIVVGSSLSVYGEGVFRDAEGTVREVRSRSLEQLRRGEWEHIDERGRVLVPAATPETKQVSLESIYALSKFAQERMCLMLGRNHDISTVALRIASVYGPRQSLLNPYAGVFATFAKRLMNGSPPLVLEDGNQQRDFVSVRDVARACRLALESDAASGMVLNIGSGERRSILDIARKTAEALGRNHAVPELTGTYRVGDVRHCFPDVSLARRFLGYEPKVSFDEGLAEVAGWLTGQLSDDPNRAKVELGARGFGL